MTRKAWPSMQKVHLSTWCLLAMALSGSTGPAMAQRAPAPLPRIPRIDLPTLSTGTTTIHVVPSAPTLSGGLTPAHEPPAPPPPPPPQGPSTVTRVVTAVTIGICLEVTAFNEECEHLGRVKASQNITEVLVQAIRDSVVKSVVRVVFPTYASPTTQERELARMEANQAMLQLFLDGDISMQGARRIRRPAC